MAFSVSKPLDTTVPKASVNLLTRLRTVALPAPNVQAATTRRKILLAEGADRYGRIMPLLGTVGQRPGYVLQSNGTWSSVPNAAAQEGTLLFRDPVTERVSVGTTEIWEFYNTTADAHPVHLHLVNFRILEREPFSGTIVQKTNSDGSSGFKLPAASIRLSGKRRPANPWEAGRKDTVQCFPGEVTRVLVSFERTGEYVYHCHILSHEDHEMMRRYLVV
jgi:spore coat protein A